MKTAVRNRIAEELNGNGSTEKLTITAPNMRRAAFQIVGDAPLVMNCFSQKARQIIRETQERGSQSRKGRKRDPKDFNASYEGSKHVSADGWLGVPATAFRSAMVSACRAAGFKMTHAKLAFRVEADGFEADGTPLVKISKGEPRYHESYVRNETGVVDLRARAMIDPGWEMTVRIRYDGDMFSATDIANLLMRAGMQVGIGEGRPDSKKSCGMGWGTFTIKEN